MKLAHLGGELRPRQRPALPAVVADHQHARMLSLHGRDERFAFVARIAIDDFSLLLVDFAPILERVRDLVDPKPMPSQPSLQTTTTPGCSVCMAEMNDLRSSRA